MALVHKVAAAVRAAQDAYAKKWTFLAAFLGVFFVSFLILQDLGFVPNPPQIAEAGTNEPKVTLEASPLVAAPSSMSHLSADVSDAGLFGLHAGELPVAIEIPTIGLSVKVSNPNSTDVGKLDAALLTGAVRYPTSGTLGVKGNVVIFAHSSYLPVVKNPAFKAFDDIQKLAPGERITVYSGTRAYTYAVTRVEKVKADDAAIPLTVDGSKLTLSTCDSFGTKSDRFVVTADFVESHTLAN